jgi:glutamine synthetase
MTSPSDLSKQQAFVQRTIEERNIRFVRLWFTDVLGFLKSVAIAPAELENAFAEGIGFDGSAIEALPELLKQICWQNLIQQVFQSCLGEQSHQVLLECFAISQCQMAQLPQLIQEEF